MAQKPTARRAPKGSPIPGFTPRTETTDLPEDEFPHQPIGTLELTEDGDMVEAKVSVPLPVQRRDDGWFSFTARVTRKDTESHEETIDRASFIARAGVFRTYFAYLDDYTDLSHNGDES